ncbi:SDR family NAD(P)-dependent oxidoreductase [Nocardioides terrisoli]|uniref:SDR family NAD(P)-dependent oxidoreductase n=1 Tax=Nocardioides terrisoli TaxID=3388267 RepID=UPI0037C60862
MGGGANPTVALRTALVDGGASGIGEACVWALAAGGHTVIVADRNVAAASMLASEIGDQVWEVDLTDTRRPETWTGDVDVLVSNSGVRVVCPEKEFPPSDFPKITALLLDAPLPLMRGAIPNTHDRGFGRIINVSSVRAHCASQYKAPYVAAKHGLEGLSRSRPLKAAHTAPHKQLCRPWLREHSPCVRSDSRTNT